MRTLLLVVLIVVAFTVGYFFRGERPEPQKHEHAAEERVKKVKSDMDLFNAFPNPTAKTRPVPYLWYGFNPCFK
jgi:hypothetical protein